MKANECNCWVNGMAGYKYYEHSDTCPVYKAGEKRHDKYEEKKLKIKREKALRSLENCINRIEMEIKQQDMEKEDEVDDDEEEDFRQSDWKDYDEIHC